MDFFLELLLAEGLFTGLQKSEFLLKFLQIVEIEEFLVQNLGSEKLLLFGAILNGTQSSKENPLFLDDFLQGFLGGMFGQRR